MFYVFRSEMKIFFDKIKEKISRDLEPEEITIIDNSSLHSKHQSFNPGKYHLKLVIKSKKLKNLNKINAHKKIFSILKDEMDNKIHALEIKII
tara:strand:+ start:1777 stop:2055 length:279 start_codon:yes stop_codon:yes gene_type:complete